MPRIIPLFQLELVLYPEERLPLHIFEPRYRRMIADSMDDQSPFGVVLSVEGQLAEVGCEAHVVRVLERFKDGRLDILVKGGARFQVVRKAGETSYPNIEVERLEEVDEAPESDVRERLITQHLKLLELAGHEPRPTRYQEVHRLSYFIAQNAGLTLAQKQDILALSSENARVSYLVEHLETLIPRVEENEGNRRKISSNGHFRDF